jgi:serine/threonine protein kinase
LTTFAPGTVLRGRYELLHLIEDDGVTETWAATDRVLNRPVLVDSVPSESARDAFSAAASAAARLIHPGIATTYDSGDVDGVPYIVTERPAGSTLADIVETHGPLNASRTVGIGSQVARALEASHRAGVVHGGVGLTTIVVGERDMTRLTRFAGSGARARLRAGGSGSATGDVNDLARALTTAAAISSAPVPLQGVLRAAQPGGTITTAGALADALDELDMPVVPDDLVGPAERTPPFGTPAVGTRPTTLAGIAIGVVLVVGIAITGFLLVNGHGSGGNGPSNSPAAGDLTVSAVHSFNPYGSPTKTENEQLVSQLADSNPSSVWSTFEYKTQHFGNLKPGTGVELVLSSAQTLHQLTVTSPSRGWVFSVYVANSPAADLAGWGQPLGAATTVENDVTQVDLKSVKGSAILVWITNLGQPNANANGFPYRVDIGELDVR